jgi:putative FmdB family regulatory protein
MPIYEYRCPEGHKFELFQRMSDPSPSACEVCGASPVTKVLSSPAIHFKGSGFYSTDYGRGGRKREGKDADGSAGSSSDSGGEPKTEKKTEKKPAETS